ncbi:MAG: twin-arginine translocase TatA/TatE family subunit [Elusimicrobia bacterium]|nr:twin-arginine translocase TatA/TatE family subunit [Elusimicrobiota bacterium]
MPNIGFTEILLIGTVALLIFGPKRIPEAARGLGKAFKSFKEGLKESAQEDEKKKDKGKK